MEKYECIYKQKLLETFKCFIDYLECHNYEWFACYGTCIGAVRHKGLIPWDDDIDIVMPREDYTRLISTYKDNDDFYIIDYGKNPDYPFTFAKFCDSNSTILETNGANTVFGIYIDIFPIDYIDKRYQEIVPLTQKYYKLTHLYERSCNTYYVHHIIKMLKGFRVMNCKVIFEDLFFYKNIKSIIKKKISRIDKLCCNYKTKYIVSFSSLYKEKDIFRSEWFESSEMVPFEYFSVRIPKGYDALLRQIYGDYMKLPPKEKQVSKHSHVYDNLSKKTSIMEARKRIAKGITIEL